MFFGGIIIGLAAFLIIGLFHPLVIKGEYYYGIRIWKLFCLSGIIFIGISLFVSNIYASAILGTFGFSCFWSIKEVFEQQERVKKGWFPANPKKNKLD
ncbi:MAG: DUF4491 family protein [Erysipelotrichales bacterium]